MKKSLKTVVSFILDETGSMESIKEATLKGVNAYIKGLKGDIVFTLTKFNSNAIETPYNREPIKKVKLLKDGDYNPNFSTPLYDAVCKTVKVLEKEAKKDEALIVAIMTDGEENASQEFTQDDMRAMIKRLEGKGNWTFVYLGANQDSYAIAEKYGISRGNIRNWKASKKGVSVMMASMSLDTMSYAASNAQGVAMTDSFFSKVKDNEE